MTSRRFLPALGLALSLLSPAPSNAQTCVKHADFEGCGLQAQQCFPVLAGPSFWKDPGGTGTWQYRRALQSPLNTCEPALGNFIPNCCGGQPPSNSPAPAISLRIVGTRLLVDYDAPNFYCTDGGDWPPFFTCTNDPFADGDRLSISDSGGPIEFGFIYFEHGTWDTGIDVSCGSTGNFQANIRYVASGSTLSTSTTLAPFTGTCPDRQTCPSSGVGKPINVGSGDVMAAERLFSVGQDPLSLPFTLTYHSSAPMFPGLVSSPVGVGWTHPYAQTLRPEDGTNNRLYHITPEGYESEYLRIGTDPYWIAINPGELRGTITQVSSEYRLTDLGGTVTRFDVVTGNWLATTDRWGNSISGAYAAGQLTTITDPEGRQIQLVYSSGQVTITLPDGNTWKLILGANSTLTQIFDPMHSGATPWHTYSYQADHLGSLRLLTSIKDDANQELEAHTYEVVTDRGLTSSQAGGTKSNVSIVYNTPTTRTVTHTIDGVTQETTTFTLAHLLGRWLPTQISGPCASCGGSGSDLQVFTYDYSNHILDKKDGSGAEQSEIQYTYDGNGMMLTRKEAVGKPEQRTTTYAYGYGAGTPSSGAPWPGFVTSVAESSVGKPGQTKVTTYAFNAAGTPETTLTASFSGYLKSTDTSPTVYTTTTLFDSHHRQTEIDGPAANQKSTSSYFADTDATLDRRGRLQQTSVYTSATAHLDTQYDNYDIFGAAKKVVDANGVETDRVTDAVGRVTSITSLRETGDPNETADYTTVYTYDSRDRLTRVTLPLGNQVQYAYENGTNRLTDTIRADASGNQRERLHLTLNVIGGKASEQAQSCNVPAASCAAWTTQRSDSFAYDTRNRLSSVAHPDATHVDYTYDTRGNLLTVRDERHTAANTLYAYDFLSRLTRVTQKQVLTPGPDVVTQYAYDAQDNLTSVTDPNASATTYAYDDFRRMQKQTSPVSGVTSYSYDPAGNLLSSTDANTAATTRIYDAANRVTSASSARTGFTTETATWTYDSATAGAYGLGRLATMTDPSGSSTYAFERRGLLRSEAKTVVGNAYNRAYGYDANGNRSRITYPSGRLVTYTFDFADRPFSAVSGGTTYVSSASYSPFGPQTQLQYGNATAKTSTYDQRYRPAENKLTAGATTLADYVYQEDAAGNITQIHDATNAVYNRDFGYDDLGRLTTANSGSSLWGTATGNGYAYDSMGNLLSLALGTSRTATFSYSGTTPKLSSVTETGSGTRSVSYDAAGNETGVGLGSFAYSARNFLATGDGNTYTYDGRGLRTVVVAPISGGVSLASLTLSPTSVLGGRPSTGTVTLTGPAPTGGAAVTLTSSNTAVATVPASVTVTAGTTSKTFTVTTLTVTSTATVTITGVYGASQNATLTVTPTSFLYTVTLAPASVVGGISSTGTVTLNGPAPTGGAVVTLSSSNTAVATLPASVTVAAGTTTKTFTVTTLGVATSTPVTISGTYGGTQSATLTVTPANLLSLTLNKTSVKGGVSSTGTVTLNGKAPSTGDVVTLSSSNTAVATVPPSVTVASGTTSKTFTVTTFAVASTTSVTITASFNGVNKTAILTVTPASVLYSVTLNPTTVAGATPSTGTVTLNGPAPTGGAVVTLASGNTSVATVPASVTVAAGASTATFTVSSLGAASTTTVTISGTYGGTQSATLTVIPLALSSLTLSQTSAFGSYPVTGTATLNGRALSGGLVVTLASGNTAVAAVPPSVTVPAGSTSGTFTVTTFTVASTTNVTLTASYSGVNKTAILTVTPTVLLYSVALSPTSVVGGNPSIGLATLNGPAPSGGAAVTLSSSNTSVATVPASTTVPAGATKKAFTVTTLGVTSSSSAVITGSYGGVNKTATQTVTAAALTSLTLNPASVVGGASTTGTVTLTGKAPPTGTVVTLSSSNPTVAIVPSSVTVTSGTTTATFTVTTSSVASITSVTLTASFAGVNKTAVLSVTPTVAVYTLVLSQTSALGGTPVTGTVTLDGPAPTGGATVTLTSSNTTAATVPPNVSVAAGTSSNTFTVTTLTVTLTKTSNITASYGGVSKSVTLTVTPTAVLYSLALSPAGVVGGSPSTGTVTLNGNAPTGGATVTLSSSNTAVATVPPNVIVAVGTSSNTFTVTTVPVFASSSVTITATYSGSKTAVLTVTPNVAFLMNREEEILASASREQEEVGPDEAQATEEIVEAPTAKMPQEKAPAFRVASLRTLHRSPFAGLFPAALRLDSNDGPLADDFGGGNGLVAGPFWDLGFGSGMAARASSARTPLVSTGSRYFFYTPEMSLMAETELTSNPTPAIIYEYIWFGGQPVAQVDSAGVTSWTFTDHLGTPLIQTSSVQGITWRAEHEPYGKVFALRTPDQHQPLRLPGQEAEQLNLGPNGATERSYNIFRWYRNGWERYTQPDPVGLKGGVNLFGYVRGRPTVWADPRGLDPIIPGAFFMGSCAGRVFAEARQRGEQAGVGWRWAHCWASCKLTKECGGPRFAWSLGWAKEFADFGLCMGGVFLGGSGLSGSCESAFQQTDIDDNKTGRTCPTHTPCEDRCGELANRDADPGPFWGIGIGWPH